MPDAKLPDVSIVFSFAPGKVRVDGDLRGSIRQDQMHQTHHYIPAARVAGLVEALRTIGRESYGKWERELARKALAAYREGGK